MIDATGRFISPLTGTVRTVTRPGDRWGFRVDYTDLQNVDRARIETLIAAQRGAANRVMFAPMGHKIRGSFPAGELLPNGNFSSTAGWTGSSCTPFVGDNLLCIRNSSATQGAVTSANIPLTVGAAYLARVFVLPGNQSAWYFTGGTTSGAFDVFNIAPATTGLASIGFIATSANFYLTLACGTNVLGDFVFFALASITRCALVRGGNQTGSQLTIGNLPVSTNNLLLPGDWIGTDPEIKRVILPLSSDSSGYGTVQFSPPLRDSPNDASPVAINNPLGRFIMSAQENPWEISPGLYSTVSIDFIEAP
jgi:hypothetical protein